MAKAREVKQVDLGALEVKLKEFVETYRLDPVTASRHQRRFEVFETWCIEADCEALPADETTVGAFAGDLCEILESRTAAGYLASIADVHIRAGFPDPTRGWPREVLKGAGHVKGRQTKNAKPLTAPMVEQMVAAAPEPAIDSVRNQTNLVIAVRSEAAVAQLTRVPALGIHRTDEGYDLDLPAVRQAARDPEGERQALPARTLKVTRSGDDLCPVEALDRLLARVPDGTEYPLAVTAGGAGVAQAKPTLIAVRRAMEQTDVRLAMRPFPVVEDLDVLRRLLTYLDPDRLLWLRDRAFALSGHAGAFRPTEPLHVRAEHVTIFPEGAVVLLVKSKTDPFGRGQYVGIPRSADPEFCPVAAIEAWIAAAALSDPDFLFPRAAEGWIDRSTAMNRKAAQAIIDRLIGRTSLKGHFTGHSFRRGFCKSAHEAGASLLSIGITTRHRRLDTIRKYVEPEETTKRRAPRALGL